MPINLNLDNIRNLDANKSYYLSNTTGQIKEAGIWQRFKCWIGVESALQKVSNLVDAVKTSIMKEAPNVRSAEIDADIKENIDLSASVKGSALKDLVRRFTVADEMTPIRNKAKNMAKVTIGEALHELREKQPPIGTPKALDMVFTHAMKAPLAGSLPVKIGEGQPTKLNILKFVNKNLKPVQQSVTALLTEISQDERLGRPQIDEPFAKHIIATLFNEDGTRNEKTIDALKTPSQVRSDFAFHIGEQMQNNRPQIVHKLLLENGIDPTAHLDKILGFCEGDKDLEDLVLEIAPALCFNSNNVLRTDQAIKNKLAALKSNIDELRALGQVTPQGRLQYVFKVALANLEGVAFPPGMLTRIAADIKNAPIDALEKINGVSPAEDIHLAIEQVRSAVDHVIRNVNVEKSFMDNGEDEVGAPHSIATRIATQAFLIGRCDKATQVRIANALNGSETAKMLGILHLWEMDMKVKDHTIVTDPNQRKFNHRLAQDQQDMTDKFAETLGYILGETIYPVPDENADINTESGAYIQGNFQEFWAKAQ